jgi:hypothetical protein
MKLTPSSSRRHADKLGIEHGPFMTNIILKYQDEVEEDFGLIHFENGLVKNGNTGGDMPRHALLTEDEAVSRLWIVPFDSPKTVNVYSPFHVPP